MAIIIIRFMIRWLVCSLGLLLTAILFNNSITFNDSLTVVAVSGLVLAMINTVIKPIVVLFSLSAILFSLGLFMVIINAGMVLLASYIYEPLNVDSFWAALLAGIVIGLVNYLVSAVLDRD